MPLVADDAPRNAADSPGRDVAGERIEVGGGECRIAVTDEEEVAAPDPAGELSVTENVRAKAIARAQEPERGERHCELLRRGGREADAGIRPEDDLAGAQVDRERRRASSRDIRCGERALESG